MTFIERAQSEGRSIHRLLLVLCLLGGLALSLLAAQGGVVHASSFTYDVLVISRVDVEQPSDGHGVPVLLGTERERSASPSVAARGASTTPSGAVVATEAAPGARFVVNSAGDALDTARVTIPGGKYNYLLENPSKSGVFADSMGFNQASLDSALRSHLVDNFGTATPSVSMVGGGTKFSVTGPMAGPSGAKWTITTAWGVDVDGTIRLITATP